MKLSLGDSDVIRASKEETKDPRVYQQTKTIGFKSNMDVDDCEIEFVDPERIAREEREKKEAEKDEDDKPKAPITAMELAPSAYSKRARFMKDLSNKSMEKTTFEEIISRNKVTTIEDLNKTNFNGLDEHLSPIAKKNALIKEQLIKELEQEIEGQEYLGEGEDSEYIPEDEGDNLDINKSTIKEPNEAIQIAHDVINSLISTLPVFQHPSPPLSPTPPSAPPASSEPPLSPSSSKETQEIQHEISLLHLRLQKKQLSKTLSKLAPKGLSETFKSYQEFNVKKDTNKAKRKNRGVLGLRKVLARHKAEERYYKTKETSIRSNSTKNDPLGNFRRSQDLRFKNKRIINKEKNSAKFALLGTKKEITDGNKEEAHLEKSMNNLRMRSSFTSGFGMTGKSFFNSTRASKKTHLQSSVTKVSKKATLKVLNPKTRKSSKSTLKKTINTRIEEIKASER